MLAARGGCTPAIGDIGDDAKEGEDDAESRYGAIRGGDLREGRDPLEKPKGDGKERNWPEGRDGRDWFGCC